jgi:hypothetical protein
MERYSEPEFAPYVTALGRFALAWNELQANMCELFSFAALERAPQPGDMVNYVPTHIWHAIRSDRSQRDMLEAAVLHSKIARGPELQEHGKWLCDRVTELENRRNDILHSPLILWHKGTTEATVMPNVFARNPRAMALAKVENLLEEIKSATEYALELSTYTVQIINALLGPTAPWPDRPSRRGPHKKPKATVPHSQNK